MATLKEISERTGYAPATISRILTGDPGLAVSPEARKKVLEEAGRLNYAATKSRRGRAPKTLMRAAAAERLTPEQQLGDPFYLYLRGHVERACLEQRIALQTLARRDGEEGGIDGVVAIGRFPPPEVEGLAALSPDLVFLNSSPDESRFDSVVLNYDLGIRLAVDHLLELGHRRVGFIGPALRPDDRGRPAPEVRRERFMAHMAAHGLLDPAFLVETPMDAHSTAAALRAYLASGVPRPTAFLAASEEPALGAVRAFTEAGLSIPGQVSLVSFNDTPLSALVSPALTSVSAHADEMARAAVRLLVERADLPGRPPVRTLPVKVVVAPSLTVRESTAAPSNCPE